MKDDDPELTEDFHALFKAFVQRGKDIDELVESGLWLASIASTNAAGRKMLGEKKYKECFDVVEKHRKSREGDLFNV